VLEATQGKLHGVPCNMGAYLRGSTDWEARLTTQILFRKAEKPEAKYGFAGYDPNSIAEQVFS
jgi:hypothetical protein